MKVDHLKIILHDGRVLVEDVTFSVNPGERVAIIGEEGNGKSSILAAIHWEKLEYAKLEGTIIKGKHKTALLEQTIKEEWLDQSPVDFLLKEIPNQVLDPNRYAELGEIYRLLSELGITDEILLERPLRTFSGGEKVKLSILKLLLNRGDILLLDEPTNDLDIETLEWLEQFLLTRKEPIIIVSHDVHLLETVATKIVHLENPMGKTAPRSTVTSQGYREYIEFRQSLFDKQVQLYQSEKRIMKQKWDELNDQKNAVRSAQINTKDSAARRILNKKMANIKSMESRYEDMVTQEMPHQEEAIRVIWKTIPIARSKRVIEIKEEELRIKDKILSKGIHLTLLGQDKTAIIGKNGVGKTTLLKMIQKRLEVDSSISLGVFPQNYEEELPYDKTPVEYINSFGFDKKIANIQLGSIRLTPEEMIRPIRGLSSGQKAKLILARLALTGVNVLLLDEPTRNLSPLSIPVFRSILSEYTGCMLAVTHDRSLLPMFQEVYELTIDGLFKVIKRV